MAIDLKELGAGIAGIAAIVAAALFGNQNFRRRRSVGQLADAEDTVGRDYVGSIKAERDAALADSRELRDELTAMKMRGAARDVKVKVLMEHVLTLTRIVVENNPEHAAWARESQFLSMFDEQQQRDVPR